MSQVQFLSKTVYHNRLRRKLKLRENVPRVTKKQMNTEREMSALKSRVDRLTKQAEAYALSELFQLQKLLIAYFVLLIKSIIKNK